MEPIMTRPDVFDAIDTEAEYQDDKWGEGKEQSLAGYFLIMEQKLADAKSAWMKDTTGRKSPLAELLKVVTVGVRALEQYGHRGNVRTVNDDPVYEYDIPHGIGFIDLTSRDGSTISVDIDTLVSMANVEPRDPELGSVLNVRYGRTQYRLLVQESVYDIGEKAAATLVLKDDANA